MKKLLLIFITSILLLSSISAKESFVSFSAGLCSGIPFYGDSYITKKLNGIEDKKRIIIGSLVTINLNPIEQATFFTGADLLADFNWNDTKYFHFLNVGFPFGVKIYPNLGGFDFGLAYELGFRADLSKISNSKDHNIAAWSNGFKILTEYNFAHSGKSKYYPTIGLSWNLMPRGMNSYDNIITFYIAENF